MTQSIFDKVLTRGFPAGESKSSVDPQCRIDPVFMMMSYSFRKTKKKLTNKMCKVFPHPVTEADLLSVLFCAMFGASNVIGGVFVTDLVKRKFDILQ